MSVESVIKEIQAGGLAIVTDDPDRENEGDLIVAADAITPEKVALFLRHTSGVICVSLEDERCEQLRLPPMVAMNTEGQGTAFTVTVDARTGVSTGISAADRSRTIEMLADPERTHTDFVRPGHVFPLRARPGGVIKRAGHTEAAIDLARMGKRRPAGVLAEVVAEDKERMADGAELRRLAGRYGLPICSVADIVRYRLRNERLIEHRAEAALETTHGRFTCHAWRSFNDDAEHLALVRGDVTTPEPVLVRVHSECLTGDVFGSQSCDCGSQLEDALAAIEEAGRGVVVYLRGHEGRGIGLAHKIAAYNLQQSGHDTVDANLLLGLPVDSREYGIGAQILLELGVRAVRLMTNNPAKYEGLDGFGLEIVERVPLQPRVTAGNARYLETKRARLGHLIPVPREPGL
ncbi:MAG: bifunctional 3,4-dihydroxy-2-butanone-4-phosphate synthase/GTP cyclohydrolase II [Solirubrobacterales bacterium]